MNIFSKIYYRIGSEWALYRECVRYSRLLRKYSASVSQSRSKEKMRYMIARSAHGLEKGMSMPSPRKDFGKVRCARLLDKIRVYLKRYKDAGSILPALRSVKGYLNYSAEHGTDVTELSRHFEKIVGGLEFELEPCGMEVLDREDIIQAARKDFNSLMQSRHSIRDFSNIPVSDGDILQALTMAAKTPSACNRQAWRTHVYRGENARELIKWQDGCRGFEDNIPNAIVVTADLKAFLDFEPFQTYVDGGLYAMNLTNALHSIGLGTIPLSCGFKSDKLRLLHESPFNIPENEVPIVIVGFGHMPEKVKVASSERLDISKTNTFHE